MDGTEQTIAARNARNVSFGKNLLRTTSLARYAHRRSRLMDAVETEFPEIRTVVLAQPRGPDRSLAVVGTIVVSGRPEQLSARVKCT